MTTGLTLLARLIAHTRVLVPLMRLICHAGWRFTQVGYTYILNYHNGILHMSSFSAFSFSVNTYCIVRKATQWQI